MLLVYDLIAIIGSANINDRSMVLRRFSVANHALSSHSFNISWEVEIARLLCTSSSLPKRWCQE